MKFLSKAVKAVVAAAVVAPTLALAAGTGPDLGPLTSAIDVSSVVTAVLAIGATMVTLYLAIKGAKVVLSMVKSG